MLSIIIDPSLEYPDGANCFSPSESYPEYPFSHISATANRVYHAVRDCLLQSGHDSEHAETPSWNPLGAFIKPGSKVFVLCNFVFHRTGKESREQFSAKCVHGSVLRSVLDYVVIATGNTGTVHFGNAPMQFCHWDEVLRETGARTVEEFYQRNGVGVAPRDLRLFAAEVNRFGAVTRVRKGEENDGVHVDLGLDSALQDIDHTPPACYRVMNYSPERTKYFHSGGRHIYVINRHILEADVIVGISKLKTHEKVGMTGALKNFVGAVGHKDSLPHYRFGSPTTGGDEYPSDRTGLLRLASAFHGCVQRTSPGGVATNGLRVADRIFRFALSPVARVTEGAWCGNDTAWRMILDLARIATFATQDGRMAPVPARKHLVFIDGIIGGEGEGPLHATPVKSGILLFGDSLMAADWAAASLMGFNPYKLPMLYGGSRLLRYPLCDRELLQTPIVCNGKSVFLSDLAVCSGYRYRPSIGWLPHLSTLEVQGAIR